MIESFIEYKEEFFSSILYIVLFSNEFIIPRMRLILNFFHIHHYFVFTFLN